MAKTKSAKAPSKVAKPSKGGGKGPVPEIAESDDDAELAEVLGAMVEAAKLAREHAYAPYSKYTVGAALLTDSGSMFTGCNVENASFGATICAERGAIMAMVAAGENKPILGVIVTAGKDPAAPCGMCRQVLAEFAPGLKLVLVGEAVGKGEDEVRAVSLNAIFPEQFKLPKR